MCQYKPGRNYCRSRYESNTSVRSELLAPSADVIILRKRNGVCLEKKEGKISVFEACLAVYDVRYEREGAG